MTVQMETEFRVLLIPGLDAVNRTGFSIQCYGWAGFGMPVPSRILKDVPDGTVTEPGQVTAVLRSIVLCNMPFARSRQRGRSATRSLGNPVSGRLGREMPGLGNARIGNCQYGGNG
jgi:hypothetical protein